MKSRRIISPIGISRLINTITNSSQPINWSGRILVNNFVSSDSNSFNQDSIQTDLSHVIIQIIPDPIIVPPVAVSIPIQYPSILHDRDNQPYRRMTNKNM